MPGTLLTGSRRRGSDELSSDEETVSDDRQSSSGRSSASKRARLDRDARSQTPSDSRDGTPTSEQPQRALNGATVGGPVTMKHQPGSIVRVRLKNFVTYAAAEFNLGPSLNMVIGPNGTGKSTLVCAICLGLGWGPVHLGRAKELGEFVKHGAREAEIEIELAGGPAQKNRNPVIRRNIRREGNKSTFFLNGQTSSQKAILKLARSFSIQIDNLCQFLPQDRVVEFAALSPVDLLTSTQRAAAPEYMVEWHEELKRLRGEEKKKQADQTSMKENLTNLEGRQNMLRADVERLQQRKEMLTRMSALEKMRPLVRYRVARLRAQEAKERKKEAQLALKDLETELEPSLRAVNAKQAYRDQIKRLVEQRTNLVDKSEERARRLFEQIGNTQKDIDGCQKAIETEREGEKQRRSELARIEQRIAAVERQMQEQPIEFDAAAYNEQIREKTRMLRDVETKESDIKRQLGDNYNRAMRIKEQVQTAQRELEHLKSQAGQQFGKLQRVSSDTAKAWKWVQENQNLFNERVHGPPIVECSVSDPKYADILESTLQNSDMLAFTCTNREDFKKLQRSLYGDLGLSDVNIRVSRNSMDGYRPPVSEDELKSYGLTSWLINHLTGPEPVLSMLCDVARIHSTGVSLQEQSNEQFYRLENSPIQSWVAGRQAIQVTRRREYGPSAVSTRVREIRKARFWTSQPVDTGAERELKENLTGWTGELRGLQEQQEEYKREQTALKDDYSRINSEKEVLEREKAEKQRAHGEFQALPSKIAGFQEKKASLLEGGLQMKDRVQAKEAEIDKLAFVKGNHALDYANAVDMLRKLHTDLFEAEIWAIEAQSELESLTERNSQVRSLLDEKKKEVQAMDRQNEEARQTARRALDECNRMCQERTDEEAEVQQSMNQEITVEELEGEIESASARIELLHGGNPDAIKQFEARQKHIDSLREKVAALEDELTRLRTEIGDIKAKWEPRLDELVQQISDAFAHNFNKIGCAGQVGVYKDDDFDQWAIQIQVKFRENEQLSILDSHRQSGGERAVSTIFYLMALQSLARSPFRVVDEINQGMDPRNERLVHERMVDIACKEHTSQYFLVTPKLLPGLKFHPRMTVHCINSGEYVPADYDELNFRNLLQVAMRVKGKV